MDDRDIRRSILGRFQRDSGRIVDFAAFSEEDAAARDASAWFLDIDCEDADGSIYDALESLMEEGCIYRWEDGVWRLTARGFMARQHV